MASLASVSARYVPCFNTARPKLIPCQDSQIRTTLFKAEYLVDFPRTMSNALADCRDSEHQAGLFEKCLRQLCEATFDDGEVEIFSWEQFKEWAAIGTTSEVHG